MENEPWKMSPSECQEQLRDFPTPVSPTQTQVPQEGAATSQPFPDPKTSQTQGNEAPCSEQGTGLVAGSEGDPGPGSHPRPLEEPNFSAALGSNTTPQNLTNLSSKHPKSHLPKTPPLAQKSLINLSSTSQTSLSVPAHVDSLIPLLLNSFPCQQ